MNYLHFLFDPISLTYIQIENIQQLSRIISSTSQKYTKSSTGQRKQIVAKEMETASFGCTWPTTNQNVEWYLDYLTGKDIVFGYGPRDIASYVNLQNVNVSHAPGNSLKVSFEATFLGDVRGHIRNVSDSRISGGTLVVDTDAILDSARKISGQWETVSFSLTQKASTLPLGNYRLFVRAKDTTQVSGDMYMSVYADSTSVAAYTKTMKSYYQIYMMDFTLGSSHAGKTIYFQAKKATATANNIYIDIIGCVAVP